MRKPSPSPSLWVLHAVVWAAFAATTIVAALPYPHRWEDPLQKAVLAIFGFLLTAMLRPVLDSILVGQRSPARLVLCVGTASIATATVWTVAYNTLPLLFFGALGVDVRAIGPWTSVLRGNVYHAFILVSWSLGYLALAHHTALREQRERALRAEIAQRDARLEALRYQLNPHYLFNALNALSTLIIQRETSAARLMISRLGGYLRSLLTGGGSAEVTVAEELSLLGQYIAVEQVRFRDALSVAIDADADARAALVPNLILQPIVENAIRHAVASSPTAARVLVNARRRAASLELVVWNSTAGATDEPSSGGLGIGLQNTRSRLEALHGDSYDLTIAGDSHGGTAVTIRLPYRIGARARPESRMVTA